MFGYNKIPIAPPGCKTAVHEATTKRATWSPHATNAWYIGTAPHYYRCHKVYVPATRSERIVQTVRFFPYKANIPQNTQQEEILQAAIKLNETLEKHIVQSVLLDKNNTAVVLKQLADIFLKAYDKSP